MANTNDTLSKFNLQHLNLNTLTLKQFVDLGQFLYFFENENKRNLKLIKGDGIIACMSRYSSTDTDDDVEMKGSISYGSYYIAITRDCVRFEFCDRDLTSNYSENLNGPFPDGFRDDFELYRKHF